MRDLTERQAEILAFIRNEVRTKGRPPTLREIGEAFGISQVAVHQHLQRMQAKGYVRIAHGKKRGVEALPEHTCAACGRELPKEDIKALIDRSSVGRGLANIAENGIDAELRDLEGRR
jgi:repressor LexA